MVLNKIKSRVNDACFTRQVVARTMVNIVRQGCNNGKLDFSACTVDLIKEVQSKEWAARCNVFDTERQSLITVVSVLNLVSNFA